MNSSQKIKVNIKSSEGFSFQLDIDIEAPFQVFLNFFHQQMMNQMQQKSDLRSLKVYFEDKMISENETKTLKKLGFKNNCNIINFEINIPNKDTILCSKILPTFIRIQELDEIIYTILNENAITNIHNLKIIKYQLQEIFELSLQRNESIESLLYDNIKLIVELDIIQRPDLVQEQLEEITVHVKVEWGELIQFSLVIDCNQPFNIFFLFVLDQIFAQKEYRSYSENRFVSLGDCRILEYDPRSLRQLGFKNGSELKVRLNLKGG